MRRDAEGESTASSYLGLLLPYAHPVVSALTATTFAYIIGVQVHLIILLAALYSLLASAQNSVNAYTDVAADRVNWPERPLAAGALSLDKAMNVSIILFMLAASVAAALMLLRPSPLFVVLVIFDVLLRVTYSLPPIRLKRYPFFGNLIASSFVVSFPFLASLLVAPSPERTPLLLFSVLLLNSIGAFMFEDILTQEGDRLVGDRTIPMALGDKRASLLIFGIHLAALALITVWPRELGLIPRLATAALQALMTFYTASLLRSHAVTRAFKLAARLDVAIGGALVAGYLMP